MKSEVCQELVNQLVGREMQCQDLAIAIESGCFKTVEDVLLWVQTAKEGARKDLSSLGVVGAVCITDEEFSRAEASAKRIVCI